MKNSARQKIIFVLCFFLYSFFCYSQKQNSVWHFGQTGAGLSFSNCAPTVLTNGVNYVTPFEGQSSISDNLSGKLLFYTDGYNIYDSTNVIMQNGYQAGLTNTLTQTIIIKKPGSSSLFYMFTPDCQGGIMQNPSYRSAFGVNWAEVDMSLNGGLGSVISVFNSLKDTSNCEMLTAVYHSNGNDIWLIGHEYKTNNFFTFLISSSGINTTPIISSVGPTIYTWQGGSPGVSNYDAIGELKASPDGNKLAFTTYYNGTTCLVDFNKSTGVISGAMSLSVESGGYGVSFSPDNSKLYITGVDTSTPAPNYSTNGKIYQFDISSNIQSIIQGSRTIIYTDPTGGFRSLKLGINGKLYVARIDNTGDGDYYLGVINNPNNLGIGCNYLHNGIYLSGLRGRWGLDNAIEDSTTCLSSNLSEIQNENIYSIFPNPNNGKFELSITYFIPGEIYKVSVLGVLGNVIQQTELNSNSEFDVSDQAKGIYFVKVESKNGMTIKKLIIE